MTVAAAEAAVGLAIVIALFRHGESLNPDTFTAVERVAGRCCSDSAAAVPRLPGQHTSAGAGCRRRRSGAVASRRDVRGVRRLGRRPCARWSALPPEAREIVADALHWIASGDFQVPLALRLDPLSALMILVVTGIGFLIHVYSTAYMITRSRLRVRALLLVPEPVRRVHAAARARRELPGDVRRLGRRRPLLVPAHRLLVPEASAADAGKKAFIVNRIGDVGFILGVLLVFVAVRNARLPAS